LQCDSERDSKENILVVGNVSPADHVQQIVVQHLPFPQVKLKPTLSNWLKQSPVHSR